MIFNTVTRGKVSTLVQKVTFLIKIRENKLEGGFPVLSGWSISKVSLLSSLGEIKHRSRRSSQTKLISIVSKPIKIVFVLHLC